MFKIKPSLADIPDEDNPYRGMHMAIDDFQNVKNL